jgi:hypothetical protein
MQILCDECPDRKRPRILENIRLKEKHTFTSTKLLLGKRGKPIKIVGCVMFINGHVSGVCKCPEIAWMNREGDASDTFDPFEVPTIFDYTKK